jgi:hypothetical protein
VLPEGKPLPIEVIAVRNDGKPLDQPVRANVRLTRINWQTNRLATAGDTTEFDSKPVPQLVWDASSTRLRVWAKIASLRSRSWTSRRWQAG